MGSREEQECDSITDRKHRATVYTLGMPEYAIYALIAAALFGLLSLVQKLTVRFAIQDSWVLLFYLFLLQAAAAPVIWAFHPIKAPGSLWGIVLAQAALNIVGNTLYYYSMYRVDVSVLGSLWPLKNLFNLGFAVFILGEALSPSTFAWIGLCFFGTILVAYNEKMRLKAFLDPAILLLAVTFLLFSISDILIQRCVTGGMDPWNQRAWSMLLCGSFSVAALPILKSKVKVSLSQVGSVGAIITCLILGTLAISQAFSYPNAFALSSILAMLDAPFLLLGLGILTIWKGQILEEHPVRVYFIRVPGMILLSIAGYALFHPIHWQLVFVPIVFLGLAIAYPKSRLETKR